MKGYLAEVNKIQKAEIIVKEMSDVLNAFQEILPYAIHQSFLVIFPFSTPFFSGNWLEKCQELVRSWFYFGQKVLFSFNFVKIIRLCTYFSCFLGQNPLADADSDWFLNFFSCFFFPIV